MTYEFENYNLFYVTENNQKLPVYLTLLFHSAIKGDEAATNAIINQFLPSIKKIAFIILSQNNLSDEQSFNILVKSGNKTLKDLMWKHAEEGFCKFILFAIRVNMISTLHTRNYNF